MILKTVKLGIGRPSTYTTAIRPFLRTNRFPLNNFCGVRFIRTASPYAEDLLDFPEETKKNATTAPHRMKLGKFAIDSNYHDENFSVKPSSSSIYEVTEGGYIEIDRNMAKKYFPEGLAGEAAEEFELSGREAWMVRENTKLLCRILDDFHPVKNKSNSHDIAKSKILETRMSIPGLTDRNELHAASPSLQYYGQELIGKKFVRSGSSSSSSGSSSSEDISLKATAGTGSFADKCLESIKSHTPRQETDRPERGVPNKILMTGGRGSGKSIVLNQMVLHARQNDWLVMFIPDGWHHVQSGPFVEPALDYLSPSDPPTDTNARPVFDNSFMSTEALRGFWRANKSKLEQLPITNLACLDKYEPLRAEFRESWGRAKNVPGRENLGFIQQRVIVAADDHAAMEDEKDEDLLAGFDHDSFAPTTLSDLVRFGVAFRDAAGAVFIDLVEELKEVTDYPILIAVDQYNCWDSSVPTAFEYDNNVIMGSDLCVTRALSLITKYKSESMPRSLKNGFFIGATSQKHSQGNVNYDQSTKSIPLVLKQPSYTRLEFLSAVSYYSSGQLYSSEWQLNDILSFRMNTASNPRLTRHEGVPYFFPKSLQRIAGKVDMVAGTIDGVSYLDDGDLDSKVELEDPEEEEMRALQASFAAKKQVKKSELTRAGRLRAKAQK